MMTPRGCPTAPAPHRFGWNGGQTDEGACRRVGTDRDRTDVPVPSRTHPRASARDAAGCGIEDVRRSHPDCVGSWFRFRPGRDPAHQGTPPAAGIQADGKRGPAIVRHAQGQAEFSEAHISLDQAAAPANTAEEVGSDTVEADPELLESADQMLPDKFGRHAKRRSDSQNNAFADAVFELLTNRNANTGETVEETPDVKAAASTEGDPCRSPRSERWYQPPGTCRDDRLGTQPTRISAIETRREHNHEVATRYRWLYCHQAAPPPI